MLAALGSSFISCMYVTLFTLPSAILPGVVLPGVALPDVAMTGVAFWQVVAEPSGNLAQANSPPLAYAPPPAFGQGAASPAASPAGIGAGPPSRQAATPYSAVPSAAAPLDEARKKIAALRLGTLTRQEWRAAVEHYGMDYGLRAMFVLVLMISAWTVSNWAAALVDSGLQRIRFDETLTKFLAKLVRWGLLLMAGLVCLGYFGVETTSFAALLGAAGLAIGLAFQGTLSNFASGAMLLIFRPYKVGDLVNVAGHLGKVYEIELFTTAIDTLDNRRIIVPNSSIYGTVIENITFHAKRRIEVAVGVSYDADIDRTREVLNRALASVPQLAKDPPPAAALLELGASSVNWAVRGWAANADYGVAKESLLRAVKVELDRAGISIPFPQLDIHLPASAATLHAMRAA